jgi:hypothetical protein
MVKKYNEVDWYAIGKCNGDPTQSDINKFKREYYIKNKRLKEIIKEKELKNKNLVDLGILERIPENKRAQQYLKELNILDIKEYSTRIIGEDEGMLKVYRKVLNLNEDEFNEVNEKVLNLLGKEYVDLREEINLTSRVRIYESEHSQSSPEEYQGPL